MGLVKVYYQHRADGTELIEHERNINLHHEACEIIDEYPWATELELSEETGEGGGFLFVLGSDIKKHASYQFTPLDNNGGLLDLEVVCNPGFSNMIGRQAVSVTFDVVSIEEAKENIKELFCYSIEDLYKKHKAKS